MYKSFIHCWAALATPLLTAHRPRCYNCMSRFLNLTRKIIEIAFLYFIQPRIGTLNMNCFPFTYVFFIQILDYPFPKIKILSFFYPMYWYDHSFAQTCVILETFSDVRCGQWASWLSDSDAKRKGYPSDIFNDTYTHTTRLLHYTTHCAYKIRNPFFRKS